MVLQLKGIIHNIRHETLVRKSNPKRYAFESFDINRAASYGTIEYESIYTRKLSASSAFECRSTYQSGLAYPDYGSSMNKIKSPLRYPGGKSRAIRQIMSHVPATAQEYREPLVGGGSVFLAMKDMFGQRIGRYCINDLNYDLYCF